jgi:hypothetical protein
MGRGPAARIHRSYPQAITEWASTRGQSHCGPVDESVISGEADHAVDLANTLLIPTSTPAAPAFWIADELMVETMPARSDVVRMAPRPALRRATLDDVGAPDVRQGRGRRCDIQVASFRGDVVSAGLRPRRAESRYSCRQHARLPTGGSRRRVRGSRERDTSRV